MNQKELFLRVAGVGSEEDFYKKYPDPQTFFKEFPQFQNGGTMASHRVRQFNTEPQPINIQQRAPRNLQVWSDEYNPMADIQNIYPDNTRPVVNLSTNRDFIPDFLRLGDNDKWTYPLQDRNLMNDYFGITELRPNRHGFANGGSIQPVYNVGDEVEMTADEVARLRSLGYKIDIVK